ncbi:DNA/RNA non-specific endonuclease [Flavobacteriales bacterium]|nr:DNA/RNA non-specific endonuclease [Flavobacteriales bacterium]
MNKTLLILLFSVQLLSAQHLVQKDIFEVCYSTTKQQPLWLSYEVECQGGGFSRKGLNFKKDVSFNGITSDNADYYKNVWDKGHLAPAADFNCSYEKLRATFSYLNCALQHEKLKRGPLKNLEKYERKLSEQYKVQVKVVLGFDANSLLLETGALVPSFFVKILSYNNMVEVYRFPNDISVWHTHFKEYLIQDYLVVEGCVE